MYRAGVQDAPQEMERNKAAAKQSTVRPTTQLLLTFPPFPVGHSAHEHGTTAVAPHLICQRQPTRSYAGKGISDGDGTSPRGFMERNRLCTRHLNIEQFWNVLIQVFPNHQGKNIIGKRTKALTIHKSCKPLSFLNLEFIELGKSIDGAAVPGLSSQIFDSVFLHTDKENYLPKVSWGVWRSHNLDITFNSPSSLLERFLPSPV